jgi:uncharacterized membrane protein YfcA
VSALEVLAVLVAGVWAGAINTIVGSGTLVTFPVLIAVGYPPVVANVSNAIGLVPGSAAGAWGYRRELTGQRSRAMVLGSASLLGAVVGAVALLELPDEAFEAIVPFFIIVALVGILFQKRLQAAVAGRAQRGEHGGLFAWLGVFVGGIYGGYFGAAQGILLLSVLGLALHEELQRLNALKNVLAGLVNLVSGVVFVLVADVAWEAAGVVAVGATIGGVLGGRYGRRLPPAVLRAVIVAVGIAAIVLLVVR